MFQLGTTETIYLLLVIAVNLAALVWLSYWCIGDALLRNKSPFLVWLIVVLFFPLGWIAWLVFRPDVRQKAQNKVYLDELQND